MHEIVSRVFFAATQQLPVTPCKASEHRAAVCPTALSGMADIEQELDDAIRELGAKAVQALQDEDPQGARIWSARMHRAIASRTQEHQDRLHAEVNARFADESTFSGTWTREVLERSGAYFDVPAKAVRRRMGGRQIG